MVTSTFPRLTKTASLAVLMASLAACGGDDDTPAPPPPPAPPPAVAVGDTLVLTESRQLLSFNRAAPATVVGTVAVSGLAAGDERLIGMDIRPADGLLYAIASTGRIYTIAPSTGVATFKAALRAATGDAFTALDGTQFGFDFNPVADRLRVVGNTGQNLRINVDTGDVITDGRITPATGTAAVSAVAYTNSFAGTTSTALYDLDLGTGLLHLQDPPNNGGLAAGVPLGVVATAVNGFDIDARNNTGYAALTVGGTSGLYSVNLGASTAAATLLGAIPVSQPVVGFALAQPAAPGVVGLTADNRLVGFDPKAPTTLSTSVAITGLAAGDTVLGIDYRPADRLLYALSSTGRVYTVDPTTGVATAKSTLFADATDTTAPYAGLVGTVFSVDFNPAADRLRVISELGQSLRINVDTGATTTDGNVNRSGTAPSVLAAAYSNSYAGTPTTVLYDLEANSNVLARQDPPNNGTLVDIGALGLDLRGTAAFDIAGGANGLTLVALGSGTAGTGGPSTLYTVSLMTGALSLYRNTGDAALSLIGGASGPALRDIAIRP